jgi:hypothetical protein
MEHFLVAQIDGAVIEARAVDAHEQQVARLQCLVLLQLTEAGITPAAVEVWRSLEVIRVVASFPVAEDDALLGVPVAG